ncbi:MAG: hypothetical protein RL722_2846 [Pseudomonadota bacterium]|jgi:hypothetical protein
MADLTAVALKTSPQAAGTTALRRLGGAALALAGGVLLSGCVVAPPRYPMDVHMESSYPTRRYVPAPVTAQVPAILPPLYFYPEKGQSEAQQDRDRYECYRWAVRQTGTDPGMTPVMRSSPEPVAGPVERDPGAAVVGAATGAIVGGSIASPRSSGKGMVLGALFGAVLGASIEEARAQDAERGQAARQRDWQAREDARLQPVEGFRRAMSACMAGRSYAVR